MRTLLVLAIVAVLCVGTAGAKTPFVIDLNPEQRAVCRHESIFTASLAGEKYPTRIAVWFHTTIGKNNGHAQAQALIDGEWKSLGQSYQGYITEERDYAVEPDLYKSLLDFVAWYVNGYRSVEKKEEKKNVTYIKITSSMFSSGATVMP